MKLGLQRLIVLLLSLTSFSQNGMYPLRTP